ncbi:MAG: alpha/beta fold hydrolase [Armatimonadetes bacterium]|nr:alpha/beta fold hydrolase [Armatimonadota bacterium]
MSQPHELLWIETAEGALAASFHLPAQASGPVPAVLMCHGFTGHRQEAHFLFVHAARLFAQCGLAVLRFDFRGSGESSGEFWEMTFESEVADALAAFDYLAGRPEIDPQRVAVLGLSLGGAVAACVAGREPRVAALVLWSAVSELELLAKRFADEHAPHHLPDGRWELGGLGLGQEFVDTIADARPLDEARAFSKPCLIVHGTKDETVNVSHAHNYARTLGDKARLHLIEGADHVFARLDWEQEASEVTAEFLADVLGAS